MPPFKPVSALPPDTPDHVRRIKTFENRHLLQNVPREGLLGMPKAAPAHIDWLPRSFVPFNCLNSSGTTHVGVHFYIYDYLFKRIWGNLEYYLRQLSRYDLVISTDDSVFLDAPLIDNLRSVYKSRVFTVLGQQYGMNVVPTFSCGNPKDIEFYCDGLPEGGCIAVGGMGTNSNRSLRSIFRYCVREMCVRKHPDTLLVYGNNTDLGLDIPVHHIPTYTDRLHKL